MQLFKQIRFWLVWGLAAPFVLLYLVVKALIYSRWRLIGGTFGLIHQTLYDQFVREKRANFPHLHQRPNA